MQYCKGETEYLHGQADNINMNPLIASTLMPCE